MGTSKRGKPISLHPLDFRAAVKGLLKVKPAPKDDDTEAKPQDGEGTK